MILKICKLRPKGKVDFNNVYVWVLVICAGVN